MNNPKVTKHPDGTRVRSHNRRIVVGREEDDFMIELAGVFPKESESFAKVYKRGGFQVARFRMRKEIVLELMYAIISELEQSPPAKAEGEQ